MNLVILSFFLLILLVFSYLLHDSDILTPSVLFCLGFLLCSFFAISNAANWKYEASDYLIFTVVIGVAIFTLVSWVTHLVMSRRRGAIQNRLVWAVPVNRSVLFVFLILQLIVFVWTLRVISRMYPSNNPLTSIGLYDHANKFTDEGAEAFPFPLGPLRGLCTSIGYYICYLIGQSYGMGRDGKEKVLLVVNLILSVLVSFEGGGRTTAVSFVIYCLTAVLIIKRQWSASRMTISFKTFIVILVAFILVILTFQATLSLMGRSSGSKYWDYICMYIGAELANLDHFLSKFHNPPQLFGYMTFYSSIRWLGSHLGIPAFIYQLDLPFRFVNGVCLGNVYTTFYAFYYDFGWWGIPALTTVMAVISQWIYEHALRFDSGRYSCLWVILYMLAANTLIMSFFSNKYFEAFFCIGMIRTMVYIGLIHLFNLGMSGRLNKTKNGKE